MADPAKPAKAPIIFAVVSCYIILRCLWRVLVPATEYEMAPWPVVSVVTDILAMTALFVLNPQIPAATPGAPIYVRYATLLFIGGITATVIMVLIRLTSERGWWTGHLMYAN